MSGPSSSLQKAIFQHLTADANVTALVGQKIYDRAPESAQHPYVTFGASDFVPDNAACVNGRAEYLQLDVWCEDQGRKWPCKDIVDAISRSLEDAVMTIETHALVNLRVVSARVVGDPDGHTTHGIMSVEALIEDNG